MPVAIDELGSTNSASIYYSPVNVDGVQYSARMVVKELAHKGAVLENLSLYHVGMRKEKAPSNYNVGTSEDGLAHFDNAISAYKVKDLIYSSQVFDQKILGIPKGKLRFSISPDERERSDRNQENTDNVSDSVSLNFGGGSDRERVNLSDVKRYAQSVKVPERITSQAQAVSWAYQALGGIRGMLSNLYGETGSRDFSMGLLSMDPTKGREMDTDKAMYSRGRVRQYLDLVQPKLYEARDNSTSEETRKFFQDLIDDCNYARQWYDRAAEGDTSIFDENRPRFSIDDKRDEVYLESVKKGDEKTASEMVRVGKS